MGGTSGETSGNEMGWSVGVGKTEQRRISGTAKRVGFYIPLNSHVWTEGNKMLVFGGIVRRGRVSSAGVRKSQVHMAD